jgi:quinol-cytochrome oxidoreductase complex cytochrome b subunit
MFANGLATTRNLHESWSWVVVISNGLAGVWALAAHQYPKARTRWLWWFTGAAELALVVQVLLGAVMVGTYDVPLPEFHAFYGFIALFAIAIIYSYRNQMRHRLYMLYGFGSLFVMGLAIRAMFISALVVTP